VAEDFKNAILQFFSIWKNIVVPAKVGTRRLQLLESIPG
jgi:hypothetical protein